MKWVMMVVLLMILQFEAHQQVFNLEMQETDYRRIQEAVQLATLDAVEQVQPTSVSSSEPIFNTAQANTVFDQTLAANLDLNALTLQPKPNTMLSVAPTVLYEQFLDWSNASFPYQYTNSTYGIHLTLNFPSIIMVLQFTMPSYAHNVKPYTFTIPVVQSYQNN